MSIKDLLSKEKKNRELLPFMVLVICILLFNEFIGTIAFVVGNSMYPTLINGDVLIVKKINCLVKNGDIVVIDTKQKSLLKDDAIVKRVIATENQVVQINYDSNTIFVDGIQLEEKYINVEDDDPLKCNFDNRLKTYTVPENSIFVLGDNRNASLDSRIDYIGMISKDDIIGNVVLIIDLGKFIDSFTAV